MARLFDSLLELQWRHIAVPCELADTEGGHDLVDHKHVDRDGARVEGTGLNPNEFPVRIPFINGLLRGPQETWDPLALFPATFLEFLSALEDRSTGPLQHPIFGERTCKPGKWKVALNADVSGGVIVDVTFRETTEDDAVSLGNTSALGLVAVVANDLTDQLAAIDPSPGIDLSDEGFDSLEDFANQVSSIGDQADLLQNKVAGKIDNVVASVTKIADAVDGAATMVASVPGTTAKTAVALGNASARIVENCNRMVFALTGLKSTLQTKQKAEAFFTTQADVTLGALAAMLQNKVTDIVTLNPLLVAAPIIPPQTVVRYYA